MAVGMVALVHIQMAQVMMIEVEVAVLVMYIHQPLRKIIQADACLIHHTI